MWSPERREITLVFLSLAAYFLAYNLEPLGIDASATKGTVFRHIGLGTTKDLDSDGRKPPGWRDKLEDDIFGQWPWDKGYIMGHLRERGQSVGTGRHGALWIWRQKQEPPSETSFADSVNNALERWGDDIPQTKVVKHVPGYSIIDNLYVFNGSVYIISDAKASLPTLQTIIMTAGNGFNEWKVLSVGEGRKILGTYGSIIRGVSWMSADSSPHNSTLSALWRTYSSLDPLIDSEGQTKLSPPQRLIFPHNRFFTDPNPDFNDYLLRRRRVDTGFHPYTAKAAFPQLTIQYYEDWEDYHKLPLPFVFERLVVADRQPALSGLEHALPPFARTLTLDVSPHWWEPIRRNLIQFLGEYDVSPSKSCAVTYLHSQSEADGLKLSNEDHDALVRAMQAMGKRNSCEIHIVSSHTRDTDWIERMAAIVKSTIILGVHGNHMMDSIFMRPTPQSTVMEFFPPDKYARDQEVVVQSIGLRYMAWWGSRSMSSDFPAAVLPTNEVVSIDPQTVVDAILKTLALEN